MPVRTAGIVLTLVSGGARFMGEPISPELLAAAALVLGGVAASVSAGRC